MITDMPVIGDRKPVGSALGGTGLVIWAKSANADAALDFAWWVAADCVNKAIRCNAICPGTVESPSQDDYLRATGHYDATMKAFVARQPMGRLGKPEEIAGLAVYLATAPYTTGQARIIDGGCTVGLLKATSPTS